MTTDITSHLFTVDCKTHSCPRPADGLDNLCHVCRQIAHQKRTGTLTKEQDWQRDVIRLAQTLGWLAVHWRAAQTKHGWKTPVQGDGKGFPDLLLVRDRIIAVELKNETAPLREEQLEWIAALEVAGVETHVWRPQDLDHVMEVLLRREHREAAA